MAKRKTIFLILFIIINSCNNKVDSVSPDCQFENNTVKSTLIVNIKTKRNSSLKIKTKVTSAENKPFTLVNARIQHNTFYWFGQKVFSINFNIKGDDNPETIWYKYNGENYASFLKAGDSFYRIFESSKTQKIGIIVGKKDIKIDKDIRILYFTDLKSRPKINGQISSDLIIHFDKQKLKLEDLKHYNYFKDAYGLSFKDKISPKMITEICKKSKIRVLSLTGSKIEDKTIEAIRRCKFLEVLDLSKSSGYLRKTHKPLNNIYFLVMNKSDIYFNYDILKIFPKLKYFDDGHIGQKMNICKYLPNIKVLRNSNILCKDVNRCFKKVKEVKCLIGKECRVNLNKNINILEVCIEDYRHLYCRRHSSPEKPVVLKNLKNLISLSFHSFSQNSPRLQIEDPADYEKLKYIQLLTSSDLVYKDTNIDDSSSRFFKNRKFSVLRIDTFDDFKYLFLTKPQNLKSIDLSFTPGNSICNYKNLISIGFLINYSPIKRCNKKLIEMVVSEEHLSSIHNKYNWRKNLRYLRIFIENEVNTINEIIDLIPENLLRLDITFMAGLKNIECPNHPFKGMIKEINFNSDSLTKEQKKFIKKCIMKNMIKK